MSEIYYNKISLLQNHKAHYHYIAKKEQWAAVQDLFMRNSVSVENRIIFLITSGEVKWPYYGKNNQRKKVWTHHPQFTPFSEEPTTGKGSSKGELAYLTSGLGGRIWPSNLIQ